MNIFVLVRVHTNLHNDLLQTFEIPVIGFLYSPEFTLIAIAVNENKCTTICKVFKGFLFKTTCDNS